MGLAGARSGAALPRLCVPQVLLLGEDEETPAGEQPGGRAAIALLWSNFLRTITQYITTPTEGENDGQSRSLRSDAA